MSVLVLSSKTGGGHEMRAQALVDLSNYLGIDCEIYRPLESGSPIYSLGTGIYNLIQKTYPGLHKLYFRFLERACLHRSSTFLLGKKKFYRVLNEFNPKIVVSVHAHLNHGFFNLYQDYCRENGSKGKFVICCGELDDGVGFSNHWINPEVHSLWVPTLQTNKAAVRRGMPAVKCKTLGPLLREPFYQDVSLLQKKSFCSKFKIDPKLPFGVLATGANGVNSHHSVLKGLISEGNKQQIVVLCGKSSRLMNYLEALRDMAKFKIVPLPYLNPSEMSILLELCDWVFGRPGAGLTSEVLAKQKIMYFDISGGIMPQEQNNLNYWQSCGFQPVLVRKGFDLAYEVNQRNKLPKVKLYPDRDKVVGELRSLLNN